MDKSELAAQIEAMRDDEDAWGDPSDERPARPRSERRQRGSVISVRVTLEELAKIQAFADDRDLSLSGALRVAALEAADRVATVATQPRWRASAASNANSGDERVVHEVHTNLPDFDGSAIAAPG